MDGLAKLVRKLTLGVGVHLLQALATSQESVENTLQNDAPGSISDTVILTLTLTRCVRPWLDSMFFHRRKQREETERGHMEKQPFSSWLVCNLGPEGQCWLLPVADRETAED